MHMKGTLVRQAASSSYKMTEARLGGKLTRQDINIMQVRSVHLIFATQLLCTEELSVSSYTVSGSYSVLTWHPIDSAKNGPKRHQQI